MKGGIKMDGRISKIISLLLKEPNIKIKEMMKQLSLTRRQINYAINLINKELAKRNLPLIQRHRDGSFSFSQSIKDILPKFNKESSQATTYSDSDRQILILMYLIFNRGYISLDHLTSFLGYSKTTISNDLREANNFVKPYSLRIEYNRLEGFSLLGSQDDIFRLATELVFGHTELLNDNVISRMNSNLTIAKNATILIMDIEQKFKAIFSDKYFKALKIIVQIILIQSLNHKYKKQNIDSFIVQTNEYQYLKKHPLLKDTDDQYLKWIALEILSSNVYDKSNLEYGPDEIQILKYIHQIVEGFKAKTLVNIEDQNQFEKRLMNHLRPACFRVKYNLPSLGTIILPEENNHGILKKIISELVQPLEQWLNVKFPDNEIKMLTYYFGYQLVGNFKNQNQVLPKYKAVVVCSNGIIMSKILIKELRALFPEINFLFTMSAREFEESNKKFDVVFFDYSFKNIITTIFS